MKLKTQELVFEAGRELSTLTYIRTALKNHLSEREVEDLKRIHEKLAKYYELIIPTV